MAYRELYVVEIREVLRLWQSGCGYRRIGRLASVDRRTARRYIETAQALGLERDADGEISDDLIAQVVAAIRPGPRSAPGAMRQHCRDHRALIEGWVAEGCRGPKIVRLLARHGGGVVVPLRTLQRFIAEELEESRRRTSTVRVADPPAGQVLELSLIHI